MTTAWRAARFFTAMGCRSTVIVEGTGIDCSRLAELAMVRIARLEACWSRFLPDSDVSQINRAHGSAVSVRPATVTLLQAMAEATMMTAGAYDPTVLDDAATSSSWLDDVAIDPVAGIVKASPGFSVDPGGIGKGLAADLVTAEMSAGGAAAVCVVIGGDGRLSSVDPRRRWTIDVAAPAGAGATAIDRIEVGEAAIATSGVRRAHLVDPSTGALCDPGDIVQVSVLAGTGASAEALTKAVLVGGGAGIADELDRQGIGVLAVHTGGRLAANATWRRHRRASPDEAAA